MLARSARAGHEVRLTDLYADGFDPSYLARERTASPRPPDGKPEIARYADNLRWCDSARARVPDVVEWSAGDAEGLDRPRVGRGCRVRAARRRNRIRPAAAQHPSARRGHVARLVEVDQRRCRARAASESSPARCGCCAIAWRARDWIAFYGIDRARRRTSPNDVPRPGAQRLRALSRRGHSRSKRVTTSTWGCAGTGRAPSTARGRSRRGEQPGVAGERGRIAADQHDAFRTVAASTVTPCRPRPARAGRRSRRRPPGCGSPAARTRRARRRRRPTGEVDVARRRTADFDVSTTIVLHPPARRAAANSPTPPYASSRGRGPSNSVGARPRGRASPRARRPAARTGRTTPSTRAASCRRRSRAAPRRPARPRVRRAARETSAAGACQGR